MNKKELKTIKYNNEFIETIKGSRFITRIFNVRSEEKAKEKIAEINALERDATHNCFAYVVGNIERFSDDGEPAKTAGYPILEAIKSKELSNVLIIVTRYFGGTLLGTGGLIRAYGNGAKSVIENTEIVKYLKGISLVCTIPYKLVDRFKRYLMQIKSEIVEENFLESVSIEVIIADEDFENFKKEYSNILEKSIDYKDYKVIGETYLLYKD